MLAYSVIMFIAAVLLILLSIAIYRGKTNLIHSYHQTKVADKSAYGKAFGKALSVVAMAPLLSGIIGLFGDSYYIATIAAVVLIIGIIIGIGFIIVVQKKYNKGIF
ncbi:MAG: DUF3784 domain-containing protein [Oscillospiraceae bacterium]